MAHYLAVALASSSSHFAELEGHANFTVPSSGELVQTFYKIVGEIENTHKVPLLTLHGGPGFGHNYLTPLHELHRDLGTPVIFYDQVGCGHSTHFREKLGDEAFWTVELFVREIDNLVDTLGLRERGFDILGHSWGGALAATYAARQPVGLRKLVISSAPASAALITKSRHYLLSQFPDKIQRVLRAEDYGSEEYQEAQALWTSEHVCNIDPFPPDLQKSLENSNNDSTAYMTMQGPSDWEVSGSLKNWEGWSQAHKIKADTLLTNGRNDLIQRFASEPWLKRIPKVQWIGFEKSSHMAHWEEKGRFIKVIGRFLQG